MRFRIEERDGVRFYVYKTTAIAESGDIAYFVEDFDFKPHELPKHIVDGLKKLLLDSCAEMDDSFIAPVYDFDFDIDTVIVKAKIIAKRKPVTSREG